MFARLLLSVSLCCLAPVMAAADEAAPIDFDQQVRPILADNCFTCHGPDAAQRKVDLRLDLKSGALGERDGQRLIEPGKPDESELLRRITSQDADDRMPPEGALSADEIEIIRRWIAAGAKWEEHWSLVPPQRAKLPEVKDAAWAKTPIDQFILARLEAAGLAPSPRADMRTLIRRLTLDLTGLPPSSDEVEAFLSDEKPATYERLVNRLLASPRFGERMIVPWLDAARYSDSNGYQTDGTRAMWPWRDWALAAINGNMPFDQFTLEQIAGDMLPEATQDQQIASGFNRNHMLNGEGGRIAEESRVEYVVDRLETTGTVWLGLTIGCSRCHDHKYDPISQREFYGLYAYFNNVAETGAVDRRSSTAAPTIELPTKEQIAKRAELNDTIGELDRQVKEQQRQLLAKLPQWIESNKGNSGAKLPEEIAAILAIAEPERSEEQTKKMRDHYLDQSPELKKLRKDLEAKKKPLDALNRSVLITMVMQERDEERETFVLERGQYDKPTEKVEPGIPSSLPPLPEDAPNNRLGLARWLIDPANPLTARVTVNRYWQVLFGAGLVRTPEDFGTQGRRPTHPQLLDYLAVTFRDDMNWDVKRLLQLIVTSAAYQQTSQVTPELLQRDPENRLLSRAPRYRLTSHMLRDQALALAGLLVHEQGGPPVQPYQPPGIWADFSFNKIIYKQDHQEKLYRRSLYTFWRRSVGPTMMFDTSPRQVCTVRQVRTNSPLHALVMLNDTTFAEAARMFAERMMREGGDEPQSRIAWAFQTATARPPQTAELAILERSYQRAKAQYQNDPSAVEKVLQVGEEPRDETLDAIELAAYSSVASVILNLDEVLNRE